jgi:hypothetical protein
MTAAVSDRVCTKLAIVGKAKERGVLLHIFLKVALPVSSTTRTYTLLPDEGITLQKWQLYALNAAQEAHVNHSEASSLVKALKIRTSAEDTSFPPPAAAQPKVINSNYSIALLAPPLSPIDPPRTHAHSSRAPIRTDKRFFIICLAVQAGYSFIPPKHPHLVGLCPYPRGRRKI